MQSEEKVSTHLCGICGQPKKLLKQATGLTMSPIYVCDTTMGRSKMPCDGHLYAIASKS